MNPVWSANPSDFTVILPAIVSDGERTDAIAKLEEAVTNGRPSKAHEAAAAVGIMGILRARALVEEDMPADQPATWRFDVTEPGEERVTFVDGEYSGCTVRGRMARMAYYEQCLRLVMAEQKIMATAATHMTKAAKNRRAEARHAERNSPEAIAKREAKREKEERDKEARRAAWQAAVANRRRKIAPS